MNWQIFSSIGYLSVGLALAAVLLWLVHWMKPHRFLPILGLICAIAAVVGAKHNSTHHVSRVETDPSIRLAEMAEAQRKKEQAMIDARTDEVDNIQFAEDAQGENLDKAGMDDVDLKYMKAIMGEDEPAWKREKRQRGDAAQEDDSLESKIGAKTKTEGADVAALEEEEPPEPILVDEASNMLADKLDFWNLRASNWILIVAIIILLLDYLRRANIYKEALLPLPLPSAWLHAFTPLPVVFHQPEAPRRGIRSQLAWFTRRGDQWVYITDRPDEVEALESSLGKLRKWPHRLDLIKVDDRMDNEFVMESAWYGRASFICDDVSRGSQLLSYCLSQLKHRRITRARAPQNVHLVWDCAYELSPEAFEAFEQRAAVSGVSLFVIPQRPEKKSSEKTKDTSSEVSEDTSSKKTEETTSSTSQDQAS